MLTFPKVKRNYEDDEETLETLHEPKLSTIEIDTDNQMENNQKKEKIFMCNAYSCSAKFSDLFSYEQHYKTVHLNECRFCRSVFPSSKLLDLHILETHDTMFKVLAQKQNMVNR